MSRTRTRESAPVPYEEGFVGFGHGINGPFRFESKSTFDFLSQMALAVFFLLRRGTQVAHSDHTTYLSGKDYQW